MTDSQTLLAQYARTGSEPAFGELVSRYIDLVYSTAFRLVGGDVQSAQDVAQIVFAALARQAKTLREDVMLGGWLHQHTRFVAGQFMRTERRRQLRERQAAEMNATEDPSESNLAQIAPVLDEAIGELDAEDRAAILLRFYERKDFRGVGEALGSSEEAARKRVDRALDKLHVRLTRRGATLSAAALGVALASDAVAAAPAGLAATISAASLAGSTLAAAAATATTAKAITMTTLQKTLVVGTIAVLATGGIYEARQAAQLREQNQALRADREQLQQQASVKNESEGPSKTQSGEETRSNAVASLPAEQLSELLRLRGKVGVLRRQLAEVAAREASERTQYQHSAQEMDANLIKRAALLADDEAKLCVVITNSLRALASEFNVPETVSQMNSEGGLRDQRFQQYRPYFFFKKWCEVIQAAVESRRKESVPAEGH